MVDSSELVRAGIAHLEDGQWHAAIRCFDEAIILRQATDWKSNPADAWGLAAAWINRSDAMRAIGYLPDAIESLLNAIRAMDFVPLPDHPAYPERLILAWTNLAACHADSLQFQPAYRAFSHAEELLNTWGRDLTPTRRFLGAMVHTNRARLLLSEGNHIAAWQDASLAVETLRDLETEPEAIPAAIQARGVLCTALAQLLEDPRSAELEQDWIARATDSAEEALILARSVEYQGEWLTGLVRYCAKIYRICQPHFLAEFILETCAPPLFPDMSSSLKNDLLSELALAKSDLILRISGSSHETDFMQTQLKILRSLQFAESELAK
ncbi:hypothetical protein ACFSSA_07800 [Luteolibacter algae]|uniref:Tetratricopeptide repeat protein n=2 Tax=Luteolibacter algae TaxID=454151 RepID=A0ABW5D9E7_9BACT